MADKNLHDIKIDDLDNPPKTPLKNILTLLALLFIILVISVVITKLILNTDDTENIESNTSTLSTDLTQNSNGNEANSSDTTSSNLETESGSSLLPAAAMAATAAAVVATVKSEPKERNVSGSKIKVRLREHVPPSSVKELPTPKATPIPKTPKPVVTKAPTKVKDSDKQYIDKVVSSSSKSSTSSSNRSVEGQARTGVYIKVGTFKDTTNAINKIKKTGLNYILIKTKDDKTITRVLIGPFKSNWAADRHLASVQHNIAKGAYITRIK
jgi:cell division septation protein DedD